MKVGLLVLFSLVLAIQASAYEIVFTPKETYKLLGSGIENKDTHETLAFICLSIKDPHELLDLREWQGSWSSKLNIPEYLRIAQSDLNTSSIECNALQVIKTSPQNQVPVAITIPVLLPTETNASNYDQTINDYVSFIIGSQFEFRNEKQKIKSTSLFFNKSDWNWAEKPIQVSNDEFNARTSWTRIFRRCNMDPCVLAYQRIALTPSSGDINGWN